MSVFGVEFAALAVALAVLLGLLGVFAAMALFARNYIKVPPSEVAIFYGRKHTFTDEKGNRATVGFRVVRGGAADTGADTLRGSWRGASVSRGARAGHHNIGFRCVKDAD